MEQLDAFLRWAAGPLLLTQNREAYAEWLVIQALGLDPGHYRLEGSERTHGGEPEQGREAISVAVRSAAYLQGPAQTAPNTISFAIQQRQAPVFVFCLLNEQDPRCADPLDLNQWLFWVVRTGTLHPERQTIGLQALLRAHGDGIGYRDLNTRMEAVLNTIPFDYSQPSH